MKAFNQYIIEKLKVNKGGNKTGDDLFNNVVDALDSYMDNGGELDVKQLKLLCSYMHDHSQKTNAIDYVYYHVLSTNKPCMIAVLDNRVLIRIDDFKSFDELVFSQTGESSEEILNNILELLNNEGI